MNFATRGRREREECATETSRDEGEEAGNECLSVAAEGQMSGQCDSSRAQTAKWPTRDRRGDRGGIAEDVLVGTNKEKNMCQVSQGDFFPSTATMALFVLMLTCQCALTLL